MDTPTTEQARFINRLRHVLAERTPPLELTADQVTDAIRGWRKPDQAFVAYVAAVGPGLAAEIWQKVCALGA